MEALQANEKFRPKALVDQSMSKLSDDDVFLDSLHRIQDIPRKLLKGVARSLSAYSLCLLEARSLLKNSYMDKLWKALYFRITNRFYEPLSKINSPGIDMKDLYFQRVFHEILQSFSEEVESNYSLQKVFEESRLFSYAHSTLLSENLERLKNLFKDHLVSIRIYPSIIKRLFSALVTSYLLQQALLNVTDIELREFKCITQEQLHMLKNILNKEIVPRLASIKFVNCKFNYDVMEWFNQMHSEFCQEICNEKRLNLSIDIDIPCKVARIDNNDDISFDEAICMNNSSNGTSNENLYAWSDSISSDCETKEIDDQAHGTSGLLKLAFVNCHFDQKAIRKLCEVMQKLQNLKSFTFFPEWKYSLICADRILPSMFQVPKFYKLSMGTTPVIEEIEMVDCPLGYYSQKLLLWHQTGECTLQHGVFVPKLKHLKIVDCSLENFRVTCSCFVINDFEDSLGGESKEGLCHTEKCNSENVWKFDAPSTCSCNWFNLISIDLSDNKLGEKGAEALAKALEHSSSLQLIKLAFCSLNTKGCSFIFKLAAYNKRLRSLDLSHNSYDGREDLSLRQLIEDGTVTELKLGTLFVPDGVTTEIVKSFSKNSTIQFLDLSVNRICDPVFSIFINILADPSTLPALEVLDLGQNLIQPEHISEFAKSLETSNRKLDYVKITGNMDDLEDDGCSDIIRRRVKKFVSKDSLHSHRVAIGMADHVSEM